MVQISDISADYEVTPNGLVDLLGYLLHMPAEKRRPVMVWSPPGIGKSHVMRQVAEDMGMEYIDVRALMLDPVDLRGIPWKDEDNRTRWAPPVFLPPNTIDGQPNEQKYLINLEELSSAPPMVQAALYQLVLERQCGEYTLPESASMVACGNRETDRGVTYVMPKPLANRFVHVDMKTDVQEWMSWAASNGIAPEVLFFIQVRPELLHSFDPTSRENAFPTPRTWEFVSDIVQGGTLRNGTGGHSNGRLPVSLERSLYKGTVGEGASIEFMEFLRVMRELPHPNAILQNPDRAEIPEDPSTLLALCGSLYRIADDVNFDAVVTYAERLGPEIGEFLVGSCVRHKPELQTSISYIRWTINQVGP